MRPCISKEMRVRLEREREDEKWGDEKGSDEIGRKMRRGKT